MTDNSSSSKQKSTRPQNDKRRVKSSISCMKSVFYWYVKSWFFSSSCHILVSPTIANDWRVTHGTMVELSSSWIVSRIAFDIRFYQSRYVPLSLTHGESSIHVIWACTRQLCRFNRAWHELIKSSQNTHLDRKQLSLCVSLIENGVNPEALAVCSSFKSSSCSTFLALPSIGVCLFTCACSH